MNRKATAGSGMSRTGTSSVFNNGAEVTTKVYPSTVIPDKNEVEQVNFNKKNYR